jgi:hypothetical protein
LLVDQGSRILHSGLELNVLVPTHVTAIANVPAGFTAVIVAFAIAVAVAVLPSKRRRCRGDGRNEVARGERALMVALSRVPTLFVEEQSAFRFVQSTLFRFRVGIVVVIVAGAAADSAATNR